ncbi:MAG: hypothetical protein RR960_08220, partial [Alistipes sp.]
HCVSKVPATSRQARGSYIVYPKSLRPLDRLEDRELCFVRVVFATSRQARGSYIAPPPSLKKIPNSNQLLGILDGATPQTPQTPQQNYYRITSCKQRTPPDVPAPFNK